VAEIAGKSRVMLLNYLECPSCSLRFYVSPRAWIPDECPRCAIPLRSPDPSPERGASGSPDLPHLAPPLRDEPPPA
jgi:hypothetical protein